MTPHYHYQRPPNLNLGRWGNIIILHGRIANAIVLCPSRRFWPRAFGRAATLAVGVAADRAAALAWQTPIHELSANAALHRLAFALGCLASSGVEMELNPSRRQVGISGRYSSQSPLLVGGPTPLPKAPYYMPNIRFVLGRLEGFGGMGGIGRRNSYPAVS